VYFFLTAYPLCFFVCLYSLLCMTLCCSVSLPVSLPVCDVLGLTACNEKDDDDAAADDDDVYCTLFMYIYCGIGLQ